MAAGKSLRFEVTITLAPPWIAAASLAPYNITAEHPDAFVLRLLNDDPDRVLSALADDRADLINPPLSVDQYLAILERGGLVATVVALRPLAGRL